MDEDEDVDILGDLDDISKISSGQLLSCDYTVHPNWLNENPEAGSFWTGSVPKNYSLENNIKVLQSEEVTIKLPEHVPSLVDLDWNKDIPVESDLIFGNDIPATVEEIVDGGIETFPNTSENSRRDEFSSDGWELAAFEVHPAPKNVKYIGPTNARSLLKVKMENKEIRSNENLTTSVDQFNKNIPEKKFKKTLRLKADPLFKSEYSKFRSAPKKTSVDDSFQNKTGKKFRKTLNISTSAIRKDKLLSRNFKISKSKGEQLPSKFTKKTSRNTNSNQYIRQFFWPETVVKLETCESDADVDIEIETDICKEKCSKFKEIKSVSNEENFETSSLLHNNSVKTQDVDTNLSSELEEQLKSTNVPSEEIKMNPTEITALEKYVHSEFFENRITKTPEQYHRIRNHILFMWQSSKPNYISKTAVRAGLKHAGDVNCISRIHKLLEQIGAINFGHQGEHFEFIRPLELFVSTLVQSPRNQTKLSPLGENLIRFARRKRVPAHFKTIDDVMPHDVNYTVSHIDGVFKPEIPIHNTSRRGVSRVKTSMDLVKCLKFSQEHIAPFKVAINLSTLLCLQLHSLSSKYEVMGFLGGHRTIAVGRDKLHLTTYKPCQTSVQSTTMCEMCPVSQVNQSDKLLSEGYDLLGWFHSHPVFPANPSRTDVETQKEMQLQFSLETDRPLVGIILSCVSMTLRCIYIMPKDLHSDVSNHGLPHEVDVDVIKDCTGFKDDVKEILAIIQNYDSFGEIVEKFKITSHKLLEPYGLDENVVLKDILPE